MNSNNNATNIKVSDDASPEYMSIDRFTRQFVESLDPKVKKVDSDEHVDLFCYTTCDASDPDYIRSCRGLVFKGDELILKAYSFNPEYTIKDEDFLEENYPNVEHYHVYESYEGTLIRVFNVDDKWYVSTHRRLDGFRSKWSSRTSFGDHFVKALEYEYSTSDEFKERIHSSPLETEDPTASVLDKFISTLDVSFQYMFLVQSNIENRIVCDAPQYPRAFHVGTFCRKEHTLADVNINLSSPKQLLFTSMKSLLDYVENKIDCRTTQGVLIHTPTEQIKVLNSTYNMLYGVRGNEPSVKYRYLQVRMSAEQNRLFRQLYPSFHEYFEMYENAIYDIAKNIYNVYMDRFIRKQFATLPSDEYKILQECHEWHKENRQENRMYLEKVIDVVNAQDPSKLNRIVKRVLTKQKQS